MYVMKTIGSVYNNNNNYYCSTNFMFIFAKKRGSMFIIHAKYCTKKETTTANTFSTSLRHPPIDEGRGWEGLHYRPANFNTPKKSYF